MDLSNFYKDNAFNISNFEALFKVYRDLLTATNEYAIQVKNNVVIPDIETYRIFPFQRILATDGTYTLEGLLTNPKVIDKYGLLSTPLVDRVAMWEDDTFTLAEKLDMLDITKTYITIEASRGFVGEKSYSVVDFKMFDVSDNELFRNLDYVLSMNRIYLLGDIAVPVPDKYIILKEIGIDFNTPSELMSGSLGVEYNEVLSKNEYNEILKILTLAALGGPTVYNLRAAVRAISGSDQGDLYDRFTRDAKKQARWRRPSYTDFVFVVVFPEEFAANMERLNIIIEYMNVIKPAYSKFFFILQSIYSDVYNILLNASDSYMDYLRDTIEEEGPIISEEDSCSLIENNDEAYSYPSGQSRLNNPDHRLNTSFRLFGIETIELDSYTDTIIPV